MPKSISIVMVLSVFFLISCGVSENEYINIITKNDDLYRELEKANLKMGFMKDVPKKGRVSLVVNCIDKDIFKQAVEIAKKHKTYQGLELQILSPQKSYTKTGKLERMRTRSTPKKFDKYYKP